MTTTPGPAPNTSPTPGPRLSGRDIGQAENAVRALLNRVIDRIGLSYPEWTALFSLDTAGPQTADDLARQQATGLQVPVAEAAATMDPLRKAGLVAPADGGTGLALTAAADAVFRPARLEVARIADELYGDLPPADLDATRRTLAEITRRANARLAATAA